MRTIIGSSETKTINRSWWFGYAVGFFVSFGLGLVLSGKFKALESSNTELKQALDKLKDGVGEKFP